MDSSAVLFNQLKAAEPFFLLAGPNVIESEEHVFRMAKHIKTVASKLGLPLVFKSSFDKANRTSSRSFQGPGMIEGLKILEKVKIAYGIPVVTDVHETIQASIFSLQWYSCFVSWIFTLISLYIRLLPYLLTGCVLVVNRDWIIHWRSIPAFRIRCSDVFHCMRNRHFNESFRGYKSELHFFLHKMKL